MNTKIKHARQFVASIPNKSYPDKREYLILQFRNGSPFGSFFVQCHENIEYATAYQCLNLFQDDVGAAFHQNPVFFREISVSDVIIHEVEVKYTITKTHTL